MAGFTDSEGNFIITTRNTLNSINFGFIFRIRLHIDDKATLDFIQKTLGVGRVYEENDECIFVVYKFEDIISVIIPIFTYANLITTKSMDFLDFKAAALIKQANPVLTEELKNEILSLKNQMNTKRSFVPFDPKDPYKLQPGYTLPAINIYWLIGFIEGDGSFFVNFNAPIFSLGQKYVNMHVLKSIDLFVSRLPNNYNKTIDSPNPKAVFSYNARTGVIVVTWGRIDALYDYILPILQEHIDVFSSRKKIDFILWAGVVCLQKTGLINTSEGKALMIKIISNFNQRRYSNNESASPVTPVTQVEIAKVLALPPVFDLDSGKSHADLANAYSWNIKKFNKLNASLLSINIYSPEDSLLHTFPNATEAIKNLDISKTSFYRYLNTGRIYKNKYKIVSVLRDL